MSANSYKRPLEALTRISFLAAPALLLAYGVVRLIDGRDGTYGPGPAWTSGHVLFVIGLLLFGPILAGLRRSVPATSRPRRITADLAIAAAFAGLLAFIRVIVIDIVAGLRATDRPELERLSDRYGDIPGVLPAVFYDLGPVLFQLGLVALLSQLSSTRPRRLPWWSPALTVLGFAVILIDLDLIPLGAAVVGMALFPAARGSAYCGRDGGGHAELWQGVWRGRVGR